MNDEKRHDKEPDFHLSKWYLDGVDDEGNVFIGYHATLWWKRLQLHYARAMSFRSEGAMEANTTLRKQNPPQLENSNCTWHPRALKTRGAWKGLLPPIRKTLLRSEDGEVYWQCHLPKARMEVESGGETLRDALGYAEELHLSVKPWRLPFGTLRWGRFLSSGDSVIWISWDGPAPLNLVFHNGVGIEQAVVSDTRIEWDGRNVVLAFSDTAVLLQGPVVSTALAAIPGIDTLFPGAVLNIRECKWRSKGMLTVRGVIKSTGWTIHEVVQWQ